jgi:broad specificity phosphatase PhoE
MRRLYIARHGETDWNAVRRLQGAADIPLNETGREQARAIAGELAKAGIVSVTTSDLSRARETGEIAAAAFGLSLTTTEPDLRERGFGVFEGLNREELEARFPEEWRAWQTNATAPPGGEPPELVIARMKRALERILSRPGPTLVISHGAAMRLVLTELGGQPVQPIANGGIYRVDAEGDARIVDAWDDL